MHGIVNCIIYQNNKREDLDRKRPRSVLVFPTNTHSAVPTGAILSLPHDIAIPLLYL